MSFPAPRAASETTDRPVTRAALEQTGEFRISSTGRIVALPAKLTSLVGRPREVADIRRLLATTRLLTLTGAGGIGKTRLALEVASSGMPGVADGAAWVELAPLHDGEHLAEHIAAALGARLEGNSSADDALVAALRGQALLLVLDNCEHLVDACAGLVTILLARCPRLRVLATSREALGVAGERSWLVPGLSLPASTTAPTATFAAEAEAVQLFVTRAQDAQPGFALTDANASAVVRVCRRLDGLPLAIELAAARVRLLAPEQIAARLDDGFAVLGAGARAALPRHRTLHAAIAWSYRLLDERERRLLERLSVFAGEWPLESAETVCADAVVTEPEVLDLLGTLVDKSLVVMREASGTARFQLLETIRQFAAERLTAAGDEHRFRSRHAQHYLALVEANAASFTTRHRREAVARLIQDLDDLRGALFWTRDHEPAIHLRLVGMLPWFWYSLGVWAEGRRWLEGALALPVAAAATRERAAALFGAGAFASLQADAASARSWLDEGSALARRVGDEHLAAYADNYLAMALIPLGLPGGEERARAALAWFREAGDLYGLRLALLLVATLHRVRNELADAQVAAEQGVAVAREFGLDRELGIALHVLGGIVLMRGDVDRADGLLREALAALRRDPQPLFIALVLDALGMIAARRGDPLLAARRFGAAEAEREQLGAALWAHDRRRLTPEIEAVRAAIGPDAFTTAWEEGRSQRVDRAIAEVLERPTQSAPMASAAPQRSIEAAADAKPPVRGTAALRVRALGPLEVWRDGERIDSPVWRQARPRELLLYLLCHPAGRTREQIGLAFWPDASTAQVKNNFHVTLHHVRKVLGRADWIVFADDRYRVNEALGIEFDAWSFERQVTRALKARQSDRRESLHAALALYGGVFLEDAGAADWHLEVRERLRMRWVEGMLAYGAALDEAGAFIEAAETYRLLVARETLHEEAYRRLMTALARSGERLQAVRSYERLATLLRVDLDAEPEADTRNLYERLRRAEVP
jgi:predicted ATPase/DNA-binding SARP family transcriptional activator